jgi:hypothetical protein
MKKLLLILLCLPMIGLGQDIRVFTKYDLMVNQVLENTVSFIKEKNTPKTEFRFYQYHNRPFINWNEEKFSKWQITDQKDKKLKL